MPAPSTGLARLTISTPRRRVDVALPDGVPLAELLPEILRHAGDGLADDGERHGGWLLRRVDGTPLSPAAGLASQDIHDGAVLSLVPAQRGWPELEYDDVVEAIAAGARRYGTGWSARASRWAGLAVAGAGLAVGLGALLGTGPPWTAAALAALGVSVVLLVSGTIAARAYGDAATGATLAAYALPYAFAGGCLLLAGDLLGGTADELRSYLLVGSVSLLLASVLAAVGATYALRVFVAGGTAGLLGILALLVGYLTSAAGAAAILLTVLVTGVAGVPLLAIRLGKLPMPVLALPSELGQGLDAGPDRARVFAAVARTDEMLTGLLLGFAVLGAASSVVLVISGGVAGRLLVAVSAGAFLLRARVFVTVRQRVPLLAAGVAGFAVLVLAVVTNAGGTVNLLVGLGVAAVAVLVALAGQRYAERAPSPYLGRAADVLDALCVVSVVPLACAVLGLYALVRGLAG